jgi:ganglioside GM2 activator
VIRYQTTKRDQCGGTELTISGAGETPDPIVLPGNLTVKGSANIKIDISSANIKQAQLTVEKKELGVWIEIPCLDNVGSCNYNDPCTLLNANQDMVCPIVKPAGLPCTCPFPAATYSIPASGLVIPLQSPGYSWLTSGDLYAKLVLIDSAGHVALCFEVYVTLAVASQELPKEFICVMK